MTERIDKLRSLQGKAINTGDRGLAKVVLEKAAMAAGSGRGVSYSEFIDLVNETMPCFPDLGSEVTHPKKVMSRITGRQEAKQAAEAAERSERNSRYRKEDLEKAGTAVDDSEAKDWLKKLLGR